MVWGMKMNTKARLLLVGVLVMVALSLLFSQFWGWTVYALQKIVALNLENSTCYGLNPVGSRIWSLLAAPIRIGNICTTLLTEYKVEPSTCERHVVDLLEEMRAEGLIVTPEEQ